MSAWRHQLALTQAARLNEVSLRPRGSGAMVKRFEEAFASYVGAKHAIGFANGTLTLEVALRALAERMMYHGVYDVATTPLTMSATTAAILNAGARPRFVDVDPTTWLMADDDGPDDAWLPVSLFGLAIQWGGDLTINDAAQTLCKHNGDHAFASYSFQSSKIMSSGEGGALVTNDDDLAQRARSIASLGYDLSQSSRIDRSAIRDPEAIRHIRLGTNARMSDLQAAVLLAQLDYADQLLSERALCAEAYRQAHQGCDWLTPQHVPEGASHSWWCYPLLAHLSDEYVFNLVPWMREGANPKIVGIPVTWKHLAGSIVRHGGEKPYASWRLTYDEPAFKHLKPAGGCPIAESIQPRLLLMSTNDLDAAYKNAEALRKAIREIGG